MSSTIVLQLADEQHDAKKQRAPRHDGKAADEVKRKGDTESDVSEGATQKSKHKRSTASDATETAQLTETVSSTPSKPSEKPKKTKPAKETVHDDEQSGSEDTFVAPSQTAAAKPSPAAADMDDEEESRPLVSKAKPGAKKEKKQKKEKKAKPEKTLRVNKDGTPRKAHRYRPGTVALREIKKYQSSVDDLVPKSPLRRIVRELSNQHGEYRYAREALRAIQAATEAKLVNMFTLSQMLAIHAKRVTVTSRDMKMMEFVKQN
jgi:histone H3